MRILLTQISTSVADDMYESAIKAGALGGKSAGAGGGGFLLLFCSSNKYATVRIALTSCEELPFGAALARAKVAAAL